MDYRMNYTNQNEKTFVAWRSQKTNAQGFLKD